MMNKVVYIFTTCRRLLGPPESRPLPGAPFLDSAGDFCPQTPNLPTPKKNPAGAHGTPLHSNRASVAPLSECTVRPGCCWPDASQARSCSRPATPHAGSAKEQFGQRTNHRSVGRQTTEQTMHQSAYRLSPDDYLSDSGPSTVWKVRSCSLALHEGPENI